MRRVTLGRVAGVFGVQGWLRVQSYTRPVENLLRYRSWWLDKDTDPGAGYEARVAQARVHGNGLAAQLTDAAGLLIEDRDLAAALIGRHIQVLRAQMPDPEPGHYYWADLEGLAVVNEQGVALGRIESMTSNGAQDVMVLRDDETERLIPFVRGSIVKAVEMEAGRVVVDWQPDY